MRSLRFSVAAPTIWNELPIILRYVDHFKTFKSVLYTHFTVTITRQRLWLRPRHFSAVWNVLLHYITSNLWMMAYALLLKTCRAMVSKVRSVMKTEYVRLSLLQCVVLSARLSLLHSQPSLPSKLITRCIHFVNCWSVFSYKSSDISVYYEVSELPDQPVNVLNESLVSDTGSILAEHMDIRVDNAYHQHVCILR